MSDDCANREKYLAHALQGEELQAFVAHAATCAECTKELNAWNAFAKVLGDQLAPLRRAPTSREVAELIARAEEPAPSPFRWALPVGGFALAAALAVFFITRPPPETPWSPAVVASADFTQAVDQLSTGAAGRAVVHLGEDELGLGASTKVRVAHAGTNSTVLQLERGVLAAHVNPARGKRNFDVETQLGRVHVVGTIFRVRASDSALEVDVVKGIVQVEPKGGAVQKVTAGNSLRVSNGTVSVSELHEDAFVELMAEPPAPKVVEAPDAGDAADAGTAEVAEVVPTVVPTKRPVVSIAEWRTQAAQGQCAKVVGSVERYLVQEPGDADAWVLLGDCRRRDGQAPKAVDAYLAAAKAKNGKGKRGLFLAASLVQDELHQPQRALGLLEQYVKSKPESRGLEASALVRKGRAQRDLGQTKAADATLRDVTKRFSDTPAASEAVKLLEGR